MHPPLIGLAHGSRHLETAPTLDRVMHATALALGQRLRAENFIVDAAPAPAPRALPAFLDLTQPDLVMTCRSLRDAGYDEAVVTPLLFTQAFHARVDTPQALAAASAQTGLTLRRTGLLGMGDDVAQVVLDRAAAAGIDESSSLCVYAVGSSSNAANDGVRELCERLAQRRGTSVTAAFATSAEPRGVDLEPRGPLGIVPLFLAPGLLLDTLVRRFATHPNVTIAAPLAELAAPLIAARYLDALTETSPLQPTLEPH